MSEKAIIAEGSLGGLTTGIVLEAAGFDVDIYERFPKVLDDRGAGIVMQAETETFLTQYGGLKTDQTGVWLRYRQYLSHTGTADSYEEMPQPMTSWGLIYRALRSAFPNERYHEGRTLNGLSQNKNGVIVHFEEANPIKGDMLVGADGSGSFVRQQLMPEIKPRYAGYVAGRGVVPESSASPTLIKTFVDCFTFQQMKRSHILCYLIPGADGEIEPGKRRLNWVWYWNVPESALPELMTGVDGRERDFSVPPGQVRAEWFEKQNAIAERVLGPQFFELWRATETPFLQPILDLAVARMVQGRVILVGDAAFISLARTRQQAQPRRARTPWLSNEPCKIIQTILTLRSRNGNPISSRWGGISNGRASRSVIDRNFLKQNLSIL